MYRVNTKTKHLEPMRPATLSHLSLLERRDLQEWIAGCPQILGEELLIIAKELILPSGTRLDLLAIDLSGALVIVELKRDGSGSDVDWQAIKYASYCSGFLEEEIIQELSDYREIGLEESRSILENFVQGDLDQLNEKQRIVLCAGDFHSDVASSVLWLRDNGLDISCVKLASYLDDAGQLFLNPTTIIPLPEARDFVTRREKRDKDRINRREFSPYHFVNVGEGERRNWDDNREFGFISAGTDRKYSERLEQLEVGHRFFAYLKDHGYVGFGEVLETAIPMRDFVVQETGQPLWKQVLRAPKALEFLDDDDRCEYAVKVAWHETRSRDDAIPPTGLSVLRAIVGRLREGDTVNALKKAFHVGDAKRGDSHG